MAPETQAAFDAAVAELEGSLATVAAPTASPLLPGRWRLLYTSRPGTASPIQRTFTGVDAFSVYQEIDFPEDGDSVPRVNNVVDFGPNVGVLRVEAEASTDTRPLPGFTPRQGKGLPFGILGVSSCAPPVKKNIRIDFQFDKAAFYFKALPFTLPYPVPFRVLGDERKGWIDVTFLSKDGTFRLSRGNKGTLFVLVKDDPPRQRLLDSIASGASDDDVEQLIEMLRSTEGSGTANPAQSRRALGAWRLVWTRQGKNANRFQQALARQVRNWQIVTADGGLENRVEPLPGVRVRALASANPANATRTSVDIESVVAEVGPLKFDLPIRADGDGFIDWLYLDERLRVTRGSKGSLFVHVKDDALQI
jgi:hypothetical protein